MISVVAAPGVKTLRTPISSSTGMSSSGMIPPPKTAERLRYTYWLHYAEGSAMMPLLQKLIFSMLPRRSPPLMRPVMKVISRQLLAQLVEPRLKQHMNYWEQELSRSEYFAGNEFTAADVQMSFPLEAAASRGGLDGRYPNLVGFLERIHARPAYRRALERGGKYDFAK